MKLIAFFAMLSITFIHADMKYDVLTHRYHTEPKAANIDQDEYHNLMISVILMEVQCMNNGVYGKVVHNQVYEYLKLLDTPIAIRVMEDIKKYYGE